MTGEEEVVVDTEVFDGVGGGCRSENPSKIIHEFLEGIRLAHAESLCLCWSDLLLRKQTGHRGL